MSYKAVKEADKKSCKSLSIPLFKCNDTVSNSAPHISKAVKDNSMRLKTLQIVRVVCIDRDKLDSFIAVSYTHLTLPTNREV